MSGMDMGVATGLGSFAFFVARVGVDDGGDDAAGRGSGRSQSARAGGRVRAVPLFVGSYLGVWTLVGVAVYAVYRPHGTSSPAWS